MDGILPHALLTGLYAALAVHFWYSRWHLRSASPMATWERAALLVSIEKTLPARFLLDQDKFPTWVHALVRCVTT